MSRVVVALRVQATPVRSFAVFTEDIASWWRPNQLFRFVAGRPPGTLAFEPREGGRFTETFDDGSVFEIGRVTVWAPGARLAFTWRQASFAPDQETRVEVTFEAVGAETRVTVTHHGWETVPPAHVARHGFPDGIFLRRHGEWWQTLLASLATRLVAPDP